MQKNTLQSLPKEVRNRAIVIAIAPGAIVPNELGYKSFNYASEKDIVHLGEVVHDRILRPKHGLIKALSGDTNHRDELIILEAHPDATGPDHDLQSPTFEVVIIKHLKDV